MKKIAIVTGASSGMGREFVLQLDKRLKQLDEIWVVARRTGKLFELETLVQTKIVACPADLTKKEDLLGIRHLLEQENPHIMVLVNAAGYGVHGELSIAGDEESLGMIDVNCQALTAVTKLCLPYMVKGGRIINMASAAAFVPQPKFAIYAASKSYVLSFSRALRAELHKRHISVTAVCPGPVDTEFFHRDHCNINQTFYKRIVMAKPDDVVKQALDDAAARREMSIYGSLMKAFYVLTKVVPHRFMLAVMRYIL